MLIQDPVKDSAKAVSESHGVDMVKDCFELETQKVLDVKKTAKSVCKSVTIKKTMQDVIRPTETEEIIPEVKGVPEAKDGKAAWANMDSAKTETITQETETITQETVTDKSVPESITGKITEEPAGEPMTDDLLNLEGFKVNSEGVIEGYENLDLILCDGMIIFPADERCQRNRRTCTGWNSGCGRSLYSGEYYFCCTRSIGEDRRTYVY